MCRRRICAVARTLVRVFAVFAVLTGVLLVHGFSGDHDLNGGAAAAPFVQVSTDGTAGVAPALTAHDHADGRHAHHADHGEHAVPGGTAAGAASEHGGHADAHACLALLTASALVLVGLVVRLRAGLAQAAAGARAYLRSSAESLARPTAADLSLLCVSRT